MTTTHLLTVPLGKHIGTVDEHQAADYLSVAVNTLRKWRSLGEGPAFVKLGRRVVYRLTDLERWLEAHLIDGEDRS